MKIIIFEQIAESAQKSMLSEENRYEIAIPG
jgi:hypothetical protein